MSEFEVRHAAEIRAWVEAIEKAKAAEYETKQAYKRTEDAEAEARKKLDEQGSLWRVCWDLSETASGMADELDARYITIQIHLRTAASGGTMNDCTTVLRAARVWDKDAASYVDLVLAGCSRMPSNVRFHRKNENGVETGRHVAWLAHDSAFAGCVGRIVDSVG